MHHSDSMTAIYEMVVPGLLPLLGSAGSFSKPNFQWRLLAYNRNARDHSCLSLLYHELSLTSLLLD